MARLKRKLTRAERRRHAFASRAKAHIARRFWHYRPDFRNRIVEAALDHWPAELVRGQHSQNVSRIYYDPHFRRQLGLSPLTWWLLGLAVKAILGALIDYWFFTAEPTPTQAHTEKPR